MTLKIKRVDFNEDLAFDLLNDLDFREVVSIYRIMGYVSEDAKFNQAMNLFRKRYYTHKPNESTSLNDFLCFSNS